MSQIVHCVFPYPSRKRTPKQLCCPVVYDVSCVRVGQALAVICIAQHGLIISTDILPLLSVHAKVNTSMLIERNIFLDFSTVSTIHKINKFFFKSLCKHLTFRCGDVKNV